MSNETKIECVQRWAAEVEKCKAAFDEAAEEENAAARIATSRKNALREAQKSFDAAVQEFTKENSGWDLHWDSRKPRKIEAA